MARVYLARDLRQNRRVAVKILRPDVAVSLGPERFLREIEIASRLAHPHILPVHDSGDADGMLYYVMPYVEGESLRERLTPGRPPLDEALAIIREVADALAYAHRLNVVHRDIKPGNILLQAGHAVVADFGVARAISAATDERVTTTGLIVGTPMYMSPEQAAGEEIDGRTDVYALGCVAYEMLTGSPPYTGVTPRDVIMRSRATPHRPVRALRPDVPQPVAEAIEKALAKQPEDRYPNALAFAEAVRAPGGWTPAAPPARNRRAAALVAVVLAIAAAFLGRAILRARTGAGAPLEIVILPVEGDTLPAAGGVARANTLFAELIDWIPGLRAADPDDLVPAGRAVRDVPLPDLLARARRAGGRYVVAGTLLPGSPARLSVDLYATETGERLSHAVDSANGAALDGPVGRIAASIVSTVAQKESLKLGSAGAVLAATNVLPAVGHMLQAQGRFWAGDLDAAAAELRKAVDADSNCGLAYQRLSVAHGLAPRLSGRARRGGRGPPPRRPDGAALGAAPESAALPRARLRRQRHRHLPERRARQPRGHRRLVRAGRVARPLRRVQRRVARGRPAGARAGERARQQFRPDLRAPGGPGGIRRRLPGGVESPRAHSAGSAVPAEQGGGDSSPVRHAGPSGRRRSRISRPPTASSSART